VFVGAAIKKSIVDSPPGERKKLLGRYAVMYVMLSSSKRLTRKPAQRRLAEPVQLRYVVIALSEMKYVYSRPP